MTYKLFINDERFPVEDDFVIARSSKQAINFIADKGIPEFISFDHDLGGEDTAMIFVNWLIEYMLDNSLFFSNNFSFHVHSQNPIGRKNIEGLVTRFLKHLKELQCN